MSSAYDAWCVGNPGDGGEDDGRSAGRGSLPRSVAAHRPIRKGRTPPSQFWFSDAGVRSEGCIPALAFRVLRDWVATVSRDGTGLGIQQSALSAAFLTSLRVTGSPDVTSSGHHAGCAAIQAG
eukprot:1069982-Rhodomonas_salina.3